MSVTTSLPQSVASMTAAGRVVADRSVSSWEEVELTIGRESAMTRLKVLTMVISGLFAALSYSIGADPLSADADTYMRSSALVSYWTTTTWTSVLVGAAGGVAGGLLIVVNRRVLATGVVIALALVPSLALAVLELSLGEPGLAAKAALRWATDAVLVVIGCAAVFALKRAADHRTVSGGSRAPSTSTAGGGA